MVNRTYLYQIRLGLGRIRHTNLHSLNYLPHIAIEPSLLALLLGQLIALLCGN